MEIKKVFVEDGNDNGIIIDGSNLSTVVKEEILDACSRWKNMFLFGYPHHEEKRIISAEAGINLLAVRKGKAFGERGHISVFFFLENTFLFS